MAVFLARRILGAIPLLLFVSVTVFALLHAAPGGPTGAYMRRGSMNAADLAALEEKLGLNDPLPIQYGKWLGRVLQGDLGMAVTTKRPVAVEILDRLPNTLTLMAVAWVVTLMIAIPVGILSAIRQYSKFDHAVTTLTFIGQSIPIFWFGLILLLVFYMKLENPFTGEPLLPAGGVSTMGAPFSLSDRIKHLILPVTMLAAGWVAWYSRFLRASMLETIHQDYVRTARAKGLSERLVVLGHGFRNAAIPLVTLMALDVPFLFTGALFTEVIFAWPGMGRLFYAAAERRDYGLLMAIIMITSVLIIFANILADMVYALLDPPDPFVVSTSSQAGASVDVSPVVADRALPVAPASLASGSQRRHDTMRDLVVRRFLRHRLAVIGLIVLTVLIGSALLAPAITQDPNALSVSERKQGPSWDHPFGTDEAGRDIFARTLHGGRISLTIGLAATLIALAIGTGLGAAAGYFGGPLDALLMRLTDAFLCFPQLFVLIVLGTLIRTTELRVLQGSVAPIALVIGVLSWMGLARLVRATFLSLKEKEFVEAARAAGSGNARIMLRHVLPGAVGPIVVQASLLVAATIITESGLSYLGYGVQPPTATWGNLLRDAQPHMQQLPIFAIAPGMMIFLTAMSINFVGDGLRDALDPYGRR